MDQMFRFFAAALLALACLAAPAAAQIDPDLRAAILRGDLAGVQGALEAGADVDAVSESALGETALMLASANPDPSFVTVLINAGASLDVRDSNGDPAVNWAAYYGHFDVLAVFAQAGADFELSGHGAPREILMRRGHQRALEAVTNLLDLAPERSIEEIGVDGALAGGSTDMLAPYLEWEGLAGARERTGRPVIQTAARNNRSEVIGVLVEAGYPVDAADSIGFTGLMEAAREGAPLAVDAFIAAGADVNHQAEPSGLSMRPLHLAAIGGSPQVLDAIIGAGAELDAQDSTGSTALHWAAFEQQPTSIRTLIDAGADVELSNRDGVSFRDIATAYGWTDLLTRIDERGEATPAGD